MEPKNNTLLETNGIEANLVSNISIARKRPGMDDAASNSSQKTTSTKKSQGKSRKSPGRSKKTVFGSDSDDISLSDLDLIANKKKLNKKSTEMSVSDIVSKKDSSSAPKRTSPKKKTAHSSSSRDDHYVPPARTETKRAAAASENYDDSVRKEKSEMLYKYNKLNANNKHSPLNFDMSSRLTDIKAEYDRISHHLKVDRSVKFFQRMLLLGVQGVEMLNTKFDPLGVDLDGWGEAMAYSLENQEYDEVLSELYEKYKGAATMSPEVKLIFMIVSSASMFAITKKLTKADSGLGNVFSSFATKMAQPQPPPPQPHIDPSLLARMPGRAEVSSDTTSDDPYPSKFRDPGADDASIQEILQKMNANAVRNKPVAVESESGMLVSEDILKNIPLNTKPKRGRPPKRKVVAL